MVNFFGCGEYIKAAYAPLPIKRLIVISKVRREIKKENNEQTATKITYSMLRRWLSYRCCCCYAHFLLLLGQLIAVRSISNLMHFLLD